MKKALCIFLCIFTAAAVFAGCSKGKAGIDLIYPINGNITSYDPQVASSSDEFLVAENCFEGLVRCDDEGNITPGCASSWNISSDGLTYTFYLQKGLRWYIFPSVKDKMGEDYNPEITAADFVFGLRRAADDLTQCPLYSTISLIQNAPEIHSGNKDASELGVTAADDYTLQITLSSADSGFLQTLSTAAAMPCNEEFFNSTNGRYGLDLKYTMFNGQFVLTSVLDSSYVIKNNSAYNGPSKAAAADVTLKIVSPDDSLSNKLLSGYYDAAYIRGYETEAIGSNSKITLVPYVNTTWTLLMNSSNGILSQKEARQALYLALSEPDYTKYTYLEDAKGYIPPSCKANGVSYTEQAQTITQAQNETEAVNLWKTAVKDAQIYSTEITVIAPKNMENAAKELIQGIQVSIGNISNVDDKSTDFSLKLETMTESEVKSKAAAGEYDIALYPLVSETESPVAFLQTAAEKALLSSERSEFESAVEKAGSASTESIAAQCAECEKILMDCALCFPVFYESNYYAQAKGVSGVQFHQGSGRVSFIYATRKN
ncbi:MAG: ABC transporter substrate-binding protein [Clostridiales bacterium]|nr:ABC transporter substrate-binding protein [Clostridiales bacterium]